MSADGVSIVICIYNGISRLGKTLDAILLLNPGISREIILVDNASTEDITDFIRTYFSSQASSVDFKVVREGQPGLCYARIAGILQARYEYLLFCDDDNALFPNYLELGAKLFSTNPRLGVIGGTGIATSTMPLPDWFPNLQRSYAVGPQRIGSGKIEQEPGHVYGAGSFFRRSVMCAILEAGFSPNLKGRTENTLLSGDDLEWCWLTQLKGYEIYYEEQLKFYHELPPQRLSTDYYIKMKSGTAAGTALLFAYHTFFKNPDLSALEFKIKYSMAKLKNWLIYTKNRMVFKKGDWKQDLGLSILKSQNQSFLNYSAKSADLYMNLQHLFPEALKNRN
jgi:glycosyltransferase involved in cell wall biosynthesis